MPTSTEWIAHYRENARFQRVDWGLTPDITPDKLRIIQRSLQAWQLGETSDGKNLIRAAGKYAAKTDDPAYVRAIELFIKEEQKHGGNLGRYLDKIGVPRVQKDWGDTLFRKVRYFNTNMEMWTLPVIVVESTAQVFYQALKDATGCPLLRQICTDILIDEAYHITFQVERMSTIYQTKSPTGRALRRPLYRYFFWAVATLVWVAHRRLFKAGGNTFEGYCRKMHYKYHKTLGRVTKQTTGSLNSHKPDVCVPIYASPFCAPPFPPGPSAISAGSTRTTTS
ncbi:MAG TPA: ferritin-like domain-containing protein [Dinghuibacter sp.]|uniref:ferritin-like domain-containing protein n=1 Tax=Dinghuibacter sp. TaxID=2024697 RepID=UPI002B7481F8|nr:ferritin-like domain-containing protein [Dinghuibacter sp.]HTJ11392.1 ferritin-like domain-containing protein [Dinghuibacter sp.]